MVRHILLIEFKADADPQSIAAVKDAFMAIPAKIDGVEAVEWGENNSPEGKNRNFSHCVMMTFTDEAARDRYLPHPEHDALRAVFRPTLQDIIVFDYRA